MPSSGTEHESDFELTKDTPYLALTGKLWDAYCENLGGIWLCYDGTTLYLHFLSLPYHEMMHDYM